MKLTSKSPNNGYVIKKEANNTIFKSDEIYCL